MLYNIAHAKPGSQTSLFYLVSLHSIFRIISQQQCTVYACTSFTDFLYFLVPVCPKTSDSPIAHRYGRCGPLASNQVCSGKKGALFCTEKTGWCGSTDAHRDEQTSTKYDASSIPFYCLGNIMAFACLLN